MLTSNGADSMQAVLSQVPHCRLLECISFSYGMLRYKQVVDVMVHRTMLFYALVFCEHATCFDCEHTPLATEVRCSAHSGSDL